MSFYVAPIFYIYSVGEDIPLLISKFLQLDMTSRLPEKGGRNAEFLIKYMVARVELMCRGS